MVKTKKNDDSKLFAFLAIFLGIIGFLIVLLARKEDKYAMFYAKQSLILFIVAVVAGIINIIPILGQIISAIVYLILLVLWIIALINSVSGKEKDTPWVGKYAKKFDF